MQINTRDTLEALRTMRYTRRANLLTLYYCNTLDPLLKDDIIQAQVKEVWEIHTDIDKETEAFFKTTYSAYDHSTRTRLIPYALRLKTPKPIIGVSARQGIMPVADVVPENFVVTNTRALIAYKSAFDRKRDQLVLSRTVVDEEGTIAVLDHGFYPTLQYDHSIAPTVEIRSINEKKHTHDYHVVSDTWNGSYPRYMHSFLQAVQKFQVDLNKQLYKRPPKVSQHCIVRASENKKTGISGFGYREIDLDGLDTEEDPEFKYGFQVRPGYLEVVCTPEQLRLLATHDYWEPPQYSIPNKLAPVVMHSTGHGMPRPNWNIRFDALGELLSKKTLLHTAPESVWANSPDKVEVKDLDPMPFSKSIHPLKPWSHLELFNE